ncbi:hypothetical protein AFLA70_103g002730 [Aspergillus flavus AF70]|nr:hypothetical protein AFLA70_103g002730 [Aspergillus flavus AF70]
MTTDRPNVPAKPVIHAGEKSHAVQARDQSARTVIGWGNNACILTL